MQLSQANKANDELVVFLISTLNSLQFITGSFVYSTIFAVFDVKHSLPLRM